VASFDEMTNVPLDLRQDLETSYRLTSLETVGTRTSRDGETGKLLFELDDGERIESVWMNDEDRFTFCVSSQAGCPLDCRFCATGAMGFSRDLTAGEILGQVSALARETGELRNIVFMGMGEPLLNLDAVIPALQVLTDEQCFGLGERRITVSTSGIVPGIGRLATCPVSPNLALSLNSPFSEQRNNIMPVNKSNELDDVLKACRLYASQTGRRVSLEYVMLGGVNTSVACARALTELAEDLDAMVNLIALNPFPGCIFNSPSRDEVSRFRAALVRRGITVTQRYKRGRDIGAACGQLRGEG
jgi:23S rRNA (adenine2503-C2)-methyltransferase